MFETHPKMTKRNRRVNEIFLIVFNKMANKWLSFLAAYRKKHPSKSMKQCMKDAAVSYSWILHKLLTLFGLERFLIFVKKLKCKRRRNSYQRKFDTVVSRLKTLDTPSIILAAQRDCAQCDAAHPEHQNEHPFH